VNPNPDYSVSTVNNTRVRPESNTYHVDPENANLLTVSQEQVDAGVPLYFTLGTREAGMMFDRFVLSTEQTLSEAQFNATPNSDTDVFIQPPSATYVAFEAESPKAILQGGSPTSFVITNDVTPSGNTALYAAGANNTGFPTSFASYGIKFNTPGTYKLYFRWRANQLYTDADPNSANSFMRQTNSMLRPTSAPPTPTRTTALPRSTTRGSVRRVTPIMSTLRTRTC
jgi:hypothetical protein